MLLPPRLLSVFALRNQTLHGGFRESELCGPMVCRIHFPSHTRMPVCSCLFVHSSATVEFSDHPSQVIKRPIKTKKNSQPPPSVQCNLHHSMCSNSFVKEEKKKIIKKISRYICGKRFTKMRELGNKLDASGVTPHKNTSLYIYI